jgi:threonine aldolase
LQKIPCVDIDMDSVQTNIVIFGFNDLKTVTSEVIARLKQDGLLVSVGTKGKIRMVTHLDINDDDIEKAAKILKKNLNF